MDPILARKPGIIRVEGGLCYIRGNSSPYFTLTCSYFNGGGADHRLILEHFPQFADLAALHLSDIDGSPSHAVDNGFYHLGGTSTFGNYNAVNWKHAASHFRITEEEARTIREELFGDNFSETAGFLSPGAAGAAKARLASWVDTQRSRWRSEADACIRNHGLVVYGDVASYVSGDDVDLDPVERAHVIADRIAEDR